MKKSDIITVAIIAVVGTLAAYFTVNALLGKASDLTYSFKTMNAITADLAEPDPEVFNAEAINPTIEVYVGECKDVDMDGKLSQAEQVACGNYGGSGSSLKIVDDEDEEEDDEDEDEDEED